ncbi:rhomboid family intramembrane serine protease [Marinilabiliaceae bacterium ANBcel2]|nr:rhomboid family intramembrane serine protease [Marinilabiliaceae bacterium ANBcel2]
MTVPFIIIAAVSIISIIAFNRADIMARYQFNPWSVIHRKEYVRLISHGFLHADWMHLLINMFVLFSFSFSVITYFNHYLSGSAEMRFIMLFFSSLIVSSIYSLFKNKNNPAYNSIGASGAVSAVVFTSIFFDPYRLLYLFAIIPIPGIVFGVLYLWYSKHMAARQVDNIGHDAHFWGAVYGLIFPLLYDPSLIIDFINKLLFIG